MRGILRVHDDKPVTERSGVTEGSGVFTHPPQEGLGFIFMWDEGVARHPTNPSPGIYTWPKNLKVEGSGYMFEDEEGRIFDLRVTDED